MIYLSIKTLFKLVLIGVSLCLEGLQGIFFFFWFFYFFCDIVKLICELRYKFFINLQLRQINNLRPSALHLRNLPSAAGKFTHFAICGNTYAPLLSYRDTLQFLYLFLCLHLDLYMSTFCDLFCHYRFHFHYN